MSSYIKKLKNPKTNKMQEAACIDDYFSHHEYGYFFRKDGKDYDWDEDNFTITPYQTYDIYKHDELIK